MENIEVSRHARMCELKVDLESSARLLEKRPNAMVLIGNIHVTTCLGSWLVVENGDSRPPPARGSIYAYRSGCPGRSNPALGDGGEEAGSFLMSL